MRWIIAVIVVAVSSFFLYNEYQSMNAATPAPPPPLAAPLEMAPFLSFDEIKSIRRSTKDGDPGVRWAAVELLYSIRDPESLSILERIIAEDPEQELRIKAVQLLDKGGGSRQLPGLIKALSDVDNDVRLAALKALGDIGDPAATPWVSPLLKDPEAEVKTEALHTLGRFQDKRKAEFAALTDQLRRQYEAAVRKSQENSK
ncbi:MAG: HEAT repeat domain-containing protein [Elusimicrobia bacterium]|nr:HEAT repeat domain-containing protein [Elusimicrobiota bacterium]